MIRLRDITWGETGATLQYGVVAADKVTVLIPLTSTGISEYPAGSGHYQIEVEWNPAWVSGTETWTDGDTSASQAFNTSKITAEDETLPLSVEVLSPSTISDADQYFSSRLFAEEWFNATADKKQQCLNVAWEIIDRFGYLGWLTSDSQNHQWPRTGIVRSGVSLDKDIIPADILKAGYEIAGALNKGIDPEREIRNLRVTSRGYSSVRTTYDTNRVPEHLRWGVPSALAWSYLSTYLRKDANGTISLHRVS